MTEQQQILDFWFVETTPNQWFEKNEAFDAQIRERFMALWERGAAGALDHWQGHASGCLALCILLDQFPRNMFRNDPRAFATDAKALKIAQHAVDQAFDAALGTSERRFVYLPFEHAEDMALQEKSVALFATMKEDDPLGYEYALKHLEVIAQFGRFPHRNAALGRENTAEEEAYLAQPGAGF